MARILWKDNKLCVIQSRIRKYRVGDKYYARMQLGSLEWSDKDATVVVIPKKADLQELKKILQEFIAEVG